VEKGKRGGKIDRGTGFWDNNPEKKKDKKANENKHHSTKTLPRIKQGVQSKNRINCRKHTNAFNTWTSQNNRKKKGG